MKPKTKKIDILGTEYDFVVTDEKNDPKLEELAGYCDPSVRRIVVDHNAACERIDPTQYYKHLRRHELLHAVFFEAGMINWSANEKMIEWWSAMFPKIIKILEQAEAL